MRETRSIATAALLTLAACAPSYPDTLTEDPARWATWTRQPEARYRGQVFEGDASLAADPCVARDGDLLRMAYTCPTSADSGGLCAATSTDGLEWTRVPSIVEGVEGVVLNSTPGAWDHNIETCSLVPRDDRLELYFSGYPDVDDAGERAPSAIGLATSTGGAPFAVDPTSPVLSATPHGYDGSDLFSASVFPQDDALAMVYVGWCVPGYNQETSCEHGPATVLLGATQGTDGAWTKRPTPVLEGRRDVPLMRDGVAEPALVAGPDGRFYLFFSAGLGDTPRVTMLAVGDSPFGPWEINPEPLWQPEPASFEACGAFAPSVLIENDQAAMWYLAMDDCGGACTSCDFAKCGCEPTWSIGHATAPWPLVHP